MNNVHPSPLASVPDSLKKHNESLVRQLEAQRVQLTQMNRELAAREKSLQLALAAGRMGTWDWDIASGKIVWGGAHEELWGMEPGSFGGTYEEFETRVHPEDRANLSADVNRALASRGEYVCEYRVLWSDGSVRWMAGRGHGIYDANGSAIRMTGVVHDITERRSAEAERAVAQAQLQASEARAHGILDSMFAFVGLFSLDGILLHANRAPLEAAQIDPAEVIGRPVIETFWINHSTHAQQQLSAAIARAARGETVREDLDVRVAGGSLIVLDTMLGPLHDPQGNIVQVVASGVDVTERRQAEAERQKLEAQLWQAQKMEALGTLAGGVAHDFNNILSAIAGNAELARQDIGGGHSAAPSIEEIRKATQRARFLVQQILAFSRKQPSERRTTALKSVVEECAAMLRATLPASVELNVNCCDDAPNVLADVTQIHQVLLNLGTNAWHALNGLAGRIGITLEVATVDERLAQQHSQLHVGRYACLQVSDTGTGMTEPQLARIFEPFYTTKSVGQGTGLGLSVVDGIVKSHEGAICVASTLGTGSTFRLYFPAVDDAPAESASVTPHVPRGQGQHILYVDDDEALVWLTVKMLERNGYRVTGFTQPSRALATLQADPKQFDLVVTDFTMPGTSGIQVARQLKQLDPDLPVILVSGYVTDDLKRQARETGIRRVISKPQTVSDLCEAVERELLAG